MDGSVQIGSLGIGWLPVDGDRVQQQAAIGGLDVPAWTAEPVIEIEVAEGGIDVVAVKAVEGFSAEIDAFRIAGRSIEATLGLEEFLALGRVLLGGGLLLIGRRLLVGALLG